MKSWQEARKEALKNKHIKRWIQHPRKKPLEPPKVMKGEHYFKRGARHKIHVGQPLMRELERAGILDYQSGCHTYKEHRPLTPSSLANVISIGWNRDPQEVLLTNAQRPSGTTIPDHVATLCKAYEGTFWFDMFRRYYNTHAKQATSPLVREWQIILRSSLDSWLCIDNQHQGMRLCRKGLVIRRDGEPFTPCSSESIIHNEGFASLLAYLNDTTRDKTFLPAQHDPFYQELIKELTHQHVIPQLIKAKLNPGFEYTCPHAAQLLNCTTEHLKKARLEGRLPYTETSDPQWPRIKGIDIVLQGMRPPRIHAYTQAQLAEAFKIPLIKVNQLRLPLSRAGNYGHQQAVLPLWETIRTSIRNTFTETPGALNLKQHHLTRWMEEARRAYRCEYGDIALECLPGTKPSF